MSPVIIASPAALWRKTVGMAAMAAIALLASAPAKGAFDGAVQRAEAAFPVELLLLLLAVIVGLLALNLWWSRSGRAGPEDPELMKQILAKASVLMWSAKVWREPDGHLAWKMSVLPESRGSPVINLAEMLQSGGLWSRESTPEYAEMERLAQTSIETNAPGYRQEFRVIHGGEVHWFHEETVIRRTSEASWRLFGVITDITDRHRMEEEVRRSATAIRGMLERADCLIWHASVSFEAGLWNWDFEVPSSGMQKRLFGDVDLVKTKRFYAGYDVPTLPENNRRSQRAMLAGDRGYQQEFKIVRRGDGQVFWIQEQVAIESAGAGRWHLVGVMLDVTSRHQADDARLEKEEHLNRILMGVDCMLWLADVKRAGASAYDWKFVIPDSLLYRKLFGRSPAANENGLWLDRYVPDLVSLNQHSSEAMRSGAPGYEQEFCFFSAGGVHWLHEQVSIKSTGDGSWQAVGLVTDITARLTAERDLAAEKERLAVTLRAMEEGVVTLGLGGEIVFMNRAAERMFGVASDDVRGRPVAEVCSLVATADAAPLDWPLQAVLREGVAADLPKDASVPDSEGVRCEVEGCIVPLRNPQSIVLGAVLVLRDVTERRRLETNLQRASKLESVGFLAGGIAHDFNNILTAIMGNIGLARLEAPPGSAEQGFLAEAHAAAERARGLTQQLLTFAKGGEPVRSAVALQGVITEVAEFASRGSRVRCEFDLPADLWPADADRGQFSQIVQNLVLNAVQAMPEGGTVRIAAANEEVPLGTAMPLVPGDFVRIEVTDTGRGIPPELIGRIFEPYFTTKTKGNGLGLATVYSIVRRHKGCIDVESGPDGGARFILRLPALRRAVPRPEAVPSDADRLRGTVLIMDDEDSIRRLLGSGLGRLGVRVIEARDGGEAVRRYREAWEAGSAPDVLIMDLTVPGGMGGTEALAAIRAINPAVRAVVASGYSSDPVVANFRDYGFCGRIVKPFDIEQLSRVLGDALDGPARS